ncbi:hypothetical protein [Vibrio sonorensis]|uniref:hypothetical protein n=1 Tax=Vibrio sonorensis TaxID=1004316 RepID=UPI001FE12897|nr:hypothetical protein [Vibrio sonorensis]
MSLETIMIIPLFLAITMAASELLTILRLEQRLTNLNYNITALTGNERTLSRDNNIAQLPYFRDFAEKELALIAKGKAGLSIATYNASTKETHIKLLDNGCPLTHRWPDFALGSLVEVTLCFTPEEPNPIWDLWPSGRFTSTMIREEN